MFTDRQVKQELERCVATACLIAQLDSRDYPVKLVGKKKQEENQSLKSAYYVDLQNFDILNDAKKVQSDEYFRFIFRVIQFRQRDDLLYEIDKWIPSAGSVENTLCVYRSDDTGRYSGDFIDHMVTVLKFIKYGF